jgi:hypothetical protein
VKVEWELHRAVEWRDNGNAIELKGVGARKESPDSADYTDAGRSFPQRRKAARKLRKEHR